MLNTSTALNTSLFQHPRRGFRVPPSLLNKLGATTRQSGARNDNETIKRRKNYAILKIFSLAVNPISIMAISKGIWGKKLILVLASA